MPQRIDPARYRSMIAELFANAGRMGPRQLGFMRRALTETAEAQAIKVFATNLKSLLLLPPLRGHAVIGIDPGLRTGCKCAAVDATGKFLGSITVFLQGEQGIGRKRPRRIARNTADAPALFKQFGNEPAAYISRRAGDKN